MSVVLQTNRVRGRKVQLMGTCLCDAFFDDVAVATVQVLEHLGCKVAFPEAQTCCGQPAFNGGDWAAARRVTRHAIATFAGDQPVVTPSGSCAAMLFHGTPLLFEKEPDRPKADELAGRIWELGDFIVNGLEATTWPGRFPARLAFHRSCHSRGTASGEAALKLLRSIADVQVVEFGEGEQCCGFGGTFAVTFPNISHAMGDLKLSYVLEQNPDFLVSADMSCLMHLGGLARKEGRSLKTMHLAQVLRDALRNAALL